jgi:hypothetical protein
MKLKTLLLSALTLGSVVAPTANAGYLYEGYHLMDGNDFPGYERMATPMIQALNEMGVPVVDGGKNDVDMCRPQEDKMTLGFYVPAANVMVICTKSIPGWLQMETLTHETVHVIQDARAGINNEDLEEAPQDYLVQLANKMDPRKMNIIYQLYTQDQYAVEIEAFYFETQPQVVVNEIQRWAF